MKKSSHIFLSAMLVSFTSCISMPLENDFVPEINIPADFDWKTIESVPLVLTTDSHVLNANGDTIGVSLPPGEYNFIVGKNTTLHNVPDNSASQSAITKAPGDTYRQIVYFPAKDKYATVMFEDLFPSKGDMDMNDAVFGLNIEFYLDNQSRLRAYQINIQPRAIGSSYEQIAIAASMYTTGSLRYTGDIYYSSPSSIPGFFPVNIQGVRYSVEQGTDIDVIPITGSFRSHFDNDTDLFLNVRNIDRVTPTENFWVYVDVLSSRLFHISNLTLLDVPQAGRVNLNIFAIFGDRGREIHFKGGRPTSKFYFPYFLSTRPKTDFSTIDNWVWAILADQSVRHPLEFVKIYRAYPNFKSWAEGGGAGSWYSPAITDSLYTASDF